MPEMGDRYVANSGTIGASCLYDFTPGPYGHSGYGPRWILKAKAVESVPALYTVDFLDVFENGDYFCNCTCEADAERVAAAMNGEG